MMANSFRGPRLFCFLAATLAAGASAQQLPDGPGKSDLEMVCTACHGMDQITLKGPRTPRQWEQMVAQMRAFGASGSNVQFTAIAEYLKSRFSRPPTPEEAAEEGVGKLPPKEPSAKLPLAQARDLSGVWMTSSWYNFLNMGPRGSLPEREVPMHGVNDPGANVMSLLTPWAKELSDKYSMYTDPILSCYSPGPQAYAAPYAFEMIPSPRRITMLLEYYHTVRRIYMDGRKHPEGNPNPTSIGYSIGEWDKETLVVDTRGFDNTPPFRIPHSDQLHEIERIRRIRDGNVLEIELTMEDPKAYTQPLRQTMYFKKDPKLEIIEHNCDGQLDYSTHKPK